MEEAQEKSIMLATILNEQTGTSICSMQPEPGDEEAATVLYNAMNNPTHKLKDFINKKIKVSNFFIEVNDMIDDETGETVRVPKTVLIAPDGKSYLAVSKGVFNSIKNACTAFGQAPWPKGLEFEVKQIPVGKGSMLTLEKC